MAQYIARQHNMLAAVTVSLVMLIALLTATGVLRALPFQSNGTTPLASQSDHELASLPQVAIAARQMPNPPAAPQSSPLTTTHAYTTYLPLIAKTDLQLYGSVTFHGVPISDVAITLYKCCISVRPPAWIQIQVITTNANGFYNFTGVPGMTAAEGSTYFAHYSNVGGDPARVYRWSTRQITSYMTDTTVYLGSFDLANVPLLAPSNDAVVSLPTTFRWAPRSEFPSDKYWLVLYLPLEGYLYYTSPFSDSYVLNSANGIAFNVYYEWFIEIDSPDGGRGASFGRLLTFRP